MLKNAGRHRFARQLVEGRKQQFARQQRQRKR